MTEKIVTGCTLVKNMIKKYRRYLSNYPFHFDKYDKINFWEPQEIALYFHIPFCIQKCKFCSYKAFSPKDYSYYQKYIKLLKKELKLTLSNPYIPPVKIKSIYVVGGTPSLLDANLIVELIDYTNHLVNIDSDVEITVECSPDTIEQNKFEQYMKVGINRLSFGIQTFDNTLAQQLGRQHDSFIAVKAIELAREIGFTNINIDLMFGFPEQTLDMWNDTLKKAVDLNPSNITIYGLEIWPGSYYHYNIFKNKATLPSEKIENSMYNLAQDILVSAEYEQVSTVGYIDRKQTDNYAQYLYYYWLGLGHIGVGTSSDSYINETIIYNESDRSQYQDLVTMGRQPISAYRILSKTEQMRRLIVRGLKLTKISQKFFYQRFGIYPKQVFGNIIDNLIQNDLMYETQQWLGLTNLGLLYYSNVFESFFVSEDYKKEITGKYFTGITPELEI